jgi:HEAT repeat protein
VTRKACQVKRKTVLEELFSGDDTRAAAVAGQVRAEDVPALIAALQGAEPDARWWAVFALAHVPGEAATTALLQAAADPDENVRAVVLHALGKRGRSEAITPLLFALNEGDYLARLASDALIQIGAPAVPALMDVLRQDAQPRVRAMTARALAAIADPSAIPALFAALEDESALVQHYAGEGLEKLGVGTVYFKP